MNVFLTDFDGKRYSAPVLSERVCPRAVVWKDGESGRERLFVQTDNYPSCNEYGEAEPQVVTKVSPVEESPK